MKMAPRWLRPVAAGAIAATALAACATGAPRTHQAAATAFPDIGYASWTDYEPPYRVFPGDEIEITTPSAPELNKTVTVQPDGRVSLPLLHSIMLADRTLPEVEATLSQAYAAELLRPQVYASVKAAPLKVFVGGEVDKAGVYDMPGDINALQGVILAGGFRTTAERGRVVIIRRGPDGRAMMRTVNLQRGIGDPARTDLVPLRRFDIVYVPRSGLAELGLLVGQLRELVPYSLGFSYALNSTNATFQPPGATP